MKTITKSALVLIALTSMHQFAYSQDYNYFAGNLAGENNIGDANTIVGYNTEPVTIGLINSGHDNTFIGMNSGRGNSSGSRNTYVGAGSGFENVDGGENTAVGHLAGGNNRGSYNSFYGTQAGYLTTDRNNNSIFGARAGFRNDGHNNAFFGAEAGFWNSASDNSFFGYFAGQNNTTGQWNVFFGSKAGLNNNTGFYNTFIGTTAGSANTTGYRNSFFGTFAGGRTTTGRENTYIGREAGSNNNTGNFNTAIGNYAQPSTSNLSYTTAIGHKSYVRVSNAVVLGSISGENSATVTTRVGIGTSAPSYLLHVNGTAAKPGGGLWTVASDKRLKKDIQPFNEGLKEVLQVNPVWFRYNGKAGMPTEKQYVGVIAQEMQKVAPHTISEFTYEDGEGHNEKYLDYDANALNYMLVNAVKELSAEVKQLKEEIAALKKGTPLPDAQYGAARLWQNAPNPYASSTVIRYFVPETAGHAQIIVFSVTGQEVYTRELSLRGESEIEISTSILTVGSYVYQLVVDGKVVDNKKMIVTK